MGEFIAAHVSAFRLGAFGLVLAMLILLEFALPRRGRSQTRAARWPANFLILIISTLLMRLAFPIVAVGVAVWAGEAGFGLFNQTAWPLWVEAVAGLILLDLTLYAQHVAFHKVPILWRLHRVHHVDKDVDVTTAVRFHPVEIALSMGIKMAVVAMFGISPVIVIVFETLLNALALFNHANIDLKGRADALVRVFIVTPDMHRIHHSVHRQESDSNYGFGLSLWDRIFRTYTPCPRDGQTTMEIGQTSVDARTASSLVQSLLLPFLKQNKTEERKSLRDD